MRNDHEDSGIISWDDDPEIDTMEAQVFAQMTLPLEVTRVWTVVPPRLGAGITWS